MYYITDIRLFLTFAERAGYELRGNYCVKERYRDRDWNVQISIDLITGKIDICAFGLIDGVELKGEIPLHEYPYWLKDIDYLVKFKSNKKIDG